MKDKVIFRKEKDGNIIAIFPYIIWTGSLVTCFDGSHGACDYWHIIKKTKPCQESEYKHLNRILHNFYGYDTKVIKRYSHKAFLTAYNKSKQA